MVEITLANANAYQIVDDCRRACVDCGRVAQLFGPKRNRCWEHFRVATLKAIGNEFLDREQGE